VRRRLRALVLALYPARVRQRYGAEIEQLWASSTTPGRDLVDVLRAALRERAEQVVVAARRPDHGAALVMRMDAVLAVIAPAALFATFPAAAAPAGVAAGLLLAARRGPRRALAVTGGVLALYTATHLAQWAVGHDRLAEAAATAAFAAAIAGVGVGVAALARRGARTVAVTLGALGALAVSQLAALALVTIAVPDVRGHWGETWLALWNPGSSAVPVDLGWQVADAAVYYPALYTFCATLVVAHRWRLTRPAVAGPT
jgi:hypothetical protein